MCICPFNRTLNSDINVSNIDVNFISYYSYKLTCKIVKVLEANLVDANEIIVLCSFHLTINPAFHKNQ